MILLCAQFKDDEHYKLSSDKKKKKKWISPSFYLQNLCFTRNVYVHITAT